MTREVRGEQPPQQPRSNGNVAKGLGAATIGLGIFFAKFKTLFFLLLNFKWIAIGAKFLLSGGSFLASVWFYALFWGWKFALLFVLLILVHELGHAAAARMYGMPVSLPFFIPGFGAFVTTTGPSTPVQSAYVSLAGPLVGGLASFACYTYGVVTGDHLWLAAAYTGFLLNLFNLFPVGFLDGGKIAAAISPRIYIVGLVAFVAAVLALHWFSPVILLVVMFSIPQAIAAFQGRFDPAYAALTFAERSGVAVAYFGLAALLGIAMLTSYQPVPHA